MMKVYLLLLIRAAFVEEADPSYDAGELIQLLLFVLL